MSYPIFPESLQDFPIYMVGIKGTGMSALAEILVRLGAQVSGSDTEEQFYTDEILRAIGVPFHEGFDAGNVPESARLVIYSAAYSLSEHIELVRAAELGLPLAGYSEALGALSLRMQSAGVSGVHGKTTTTAMAGMIVRSLGLPGLVLAGSAVAGFDGKSTLFQGQQFFIAETCEYRRHFLKFAPSYIVLTSVEPDHLDYFRDYADIQDAFTEYAEKLPQKGTLIYCADDPGAVQVAKRVHALRQDIRLIPYGQSASGPFHIGAIEEHPGELRFSIDAFDRTFSLHVPGRHNVLNATAAIALVRSIAIGDFASSAGDFASSAGDFASSAGDFASGAATAIAEFRGSRRRSEVIGELDGILIIDDYAHHPTAISKTLSGIASFYPGRRIVVDFMSHTYSRTAALLDEFSHAFDAADRVITHRIYASARERVGTVTGQDLAAGIRRYHARVTYHEEVMDALPDILSDLRAGDIFITMGAGDNWKLGRALYSALKGRRAGVAG